MTEIRQSRRASLAAEALRQGSGVPPWAVVRDSALRLERGGAELLDLVADDAADRSRWPYEPTTLAAAVLRETDHVSVVIPIDPGGAAPYHLARYVATLGYIAPDRILLEVTGRLDLAERARGDELLRLVEALWGSWDREAIVADKEAGIYFDPSAVPDLDFVGEFFRVRGALNLPRPPGSFPEVLVATGESLETGVETGVAS